MLEINQLQRYTKRSGVAIQPGRKILIGKGIAIENRTKKVLYVKPQSPSSSAKPAKAKKSPRAAAKAKSVKAKARK